VRHHLADCDVDMGTRLDRINPRGFTLE